MSDVLMKAIQQFVKKNHEYLSQTCDQSEFADLLHVVYQSVENNKSTQEKVKAIKRELADGENIDASDFIEKDIDKYLERLVNHIEKAKKRSGKDRSRSRSRDDPLERNNLKESSASSDDDDNKNHKLLIKRRGDKDNKQRGGKGDYKRGDRRDNYNNRNQNQNQNNRRQGYANMETFTKVLQQYMQQLGGGQVNLEQLFSQFKNNNNNRQDRNRKDTVFILNPPQEFRNLQEITEIFKGKGEIVNVNVQGRHPSIQFKKFQDAQHLINDVKFIVHKGCKLELSAIPGRPRQFNKNKEEVKVNEENVNQPQQQQQPQTLQQQQSQPAPELDEKKKEKIDAKNLESLKANLNTLLAEKIRTLLALSKRNYPQDLLDEIEEQKKNLKQLKDNTKNLNKLEQVKAEISEIQDLFDYSILVKGLPEQLFETRTVMKVLNDYFQQFGKIDTLAVRLKERAAVLKFLSFESAEKAYLAPQQYTLEFVNPSIIRYLQAKE